MTENNNKKDLNAIKSTVYYGWLPYVNYVNDKEKARNEFEKYKIIIIGKPDKEIEEDSLFIINELNITGKWIYGYINLHKKTEISEEETIVELKKDVDYWKNKKVYGIFCDLIDRSTIWIKNEIINYIRSNGLRIVANSWEHKNCFNHDFTKSLLDEKDFICFESQFYYTIDYHRGQRPEVGDILVKLSEDKRFGFYKKIEVNYSKRVEKWKKMNKFGIKTMSLNTVFEKEYSEKIYRDIVEKSKEMGIDEISLSAKDYCAQDELRIY